MFSPMKACTGDGVKRRTVLVTLGLGLVGCATVGPSAVSRFAGVWDWRFETSSFAPEPASDGPWWLFADGDAWEQLSAPITRSGGGPWGRAHLLVEGELSAPGAFGHLSAYRRELRVTQVIEARVIEAYDRPLGS